MGAVATADSGHGALGTPECKPTGKPFFEVAQRADPGVKRITATTRLFTNGSWSTEVYDTDGKLARTSSGCLDDARLTRIRDDLQSAKWTVSHRDVVCRSDLPRFTVDKWKDRTLFTDRTCNADVLDHESQQALDRISVVLKIPDDLDGAREACGLNPLAPGCM